MGYDSLFFILELHYYGMKFVSVMLIVSVIVFLFIFGCPGTPPVCGNEICEIGENSENCSQDCGGITNCGNGVCEVGETPESCSQDCAQSHRECIIENNIPTCALVTGPGKNDCSVEVGCGGYCGNSGCDELETCESCQEDCGLCPPENKGYCKQALFSGNPEDKIDIFFIPDRYVDMEQWANDINLFLYATPNDEPTDESQYDNQGNYYGDVYNYQGFFNTEPMKTYKSRFNIWYLDINNLELWEENIDNAYLPNQSMLTAKNYADNCLTGEQESDLVFIIVNNDTISGPGGFGMYDRNAAISNRSEWWIDLDGNVEGKHLRIGTIIHEFGHGFVNLADEYPNTGVIHGVNYFTTRINIDNSGCTKWCNGADTNTVCLNALEKFRNCLEDAGFQFYPNETEFIGNNTYYDILNPCMLENDSRGESWFYLENCNFGKDCYSDSGCYWNAKGLNTFKPSLTSIMSDSESGHFNTVSINKIIEKINSISVE